MKRFVLYTGILAFTFALTACSTLDKTAVKKTDRVAVALVGVDKHLQYGSDFAIGSMVQRLAQSEEFNLKPIAKKLHRKTFGTYAEFMPYTLISEKKVIKRSEYKNFRLFDTETEEELFKKSSNFVTVKNYKKYRPEFLNRGHRKELIKAMPETADAMLMVGLYYELDKQNTMIPGYTKAKAVAHLNMELVKPNGEKIMNIEKEAQSDKSIEIAFDWAILKPEKIRPLCSTATTRVMDKAEKFIEDEMAG
jgi:hypothetical protein